VSTQDSDFYRTLTLVLAALFVFFVVIIVAALMITDTDDSAKTAPDARIAAKVDELIAPVGQVNTDASAAAASCAFSASRFASRLALSATATLATAAVAVINGSAAAIDDLLSNPGHQKMILPILSIATHQTLKLEPQEL